MYELTDYGPIPEDWCLRPVGDMGEVVTGKALAVDGPGEQRPYLRTRNVFDGRIDINDVLSMPMTDEQFRHFMVKKGDVQQFSEWRLWLGGAERGSVGKRM